MASVTNEELLISLREKHGQDFVTLSDLQAPTSEFMMRYFATVLGALGIDIAAMTNNEKLQSNPHAEMYRDILPYLQVFNAVKKVYPIPKFIKNFSLMSLMEPKPTDVHYVAVMDNFYDYYYQRASDLLKPRFDELEAMKRQLQEKEELRDQLQQQINDRVAARSKCKIELAKTEQELQEKQAAVEGLREQLRLLEPQDQQLKAEVQQLQQEREQLEEQLEAQQELRQVLEELHQLKLRQAEQEEILALKQGALQEKAERRRFLDECIALETQATHEVEELVASASQADEKKRSVQELEANLEKMLKKERAQEKRLQELEVRKAAMEADRVATEEGDAALKKEIAEWESRCEEVEKSISQRKQEIASTREQQLEVKKKIEEMKEKHRALREAFQCEHDKMYEKMETFTTQYIEAARRLMDDDA